MSPYSEFVEFVIEQMALIGQPRVRAMFGGYGVYLEDRMFALIVDDRLYFKTDLVTRREFEARELGPFTYVSGGKCVALQYFEAPPDVFEERESMRTWAQKALAAAARAKKANDPSDNVHKPRRPRRAAKRKR